VAAPSAGPRAPTDLWQPSVDGLVAAVEAHRAASPWRGRLDAAILAARRSWVAKFALGEAAVRLRKLTWYEKQRAAYTSNGSPDAELSPELPATLDPVIDALTADQRHAFETLTVKGVPIDVLAEDLQTTRADVYQTLQAARRVLRRRLTHADST
jgi:DNA-directed RNA polymerase specialized sigma24 family protein